MEVFDQRNSKRMGQFDYLIMKQTENQIAVIEPGHCGMWNDRSYVRIVIVLLAICYKCPIPIACIHNRAYNWGMITIGSMLWIVAALLVVLPVSTIAYDIIDNRKTKHTGKAVNEQ